MNLTCIICSDGLTPSSDIYSTRCGHLFHYPCLVQWIERSQTCPQCRKTAEQRTIHRIYFNLADTDDEDPVTLQNKLDDLQIQIDLKEKDVKNLLEKHKKMEAQNVALRQEVADLEYQKRLNECVVNSLNDQVSFFQAKSEDRDKIAEELNNVKIKTRKEIIAMSRNQNDGDPSVTLTATLKKATALIAARQRSDESLRVEITKYRRRITRLQESIPSEDIITISDSP